MLRKILTITIVAVLILSFGCKKKEPQPVAPAAPETQEQLEGAGQE